eukprot:scaffold11625_cov123-Isochrysis_galbana.AAC.8
MQHSLLPKIAVLTVTQQPLAERSPLQLGSADLVPKKTAAPLPRGLPRLPLAPRVEQPAPPHVEQPPQVATPDTVNFQQPHWPCWQAGAARAILPIARAVAVSARPLRTPAAARLLLIQSVAPSAAKIRPRVEHVVWTAPHQQRHGDATGAARRPEDPVQAGREETTRQEREEVTHVHFDVGGREARNLLRV